MIHCSRGQRPRRPVGSPKGELSAKLAEGWPLADKLPSLPSYKGSPSRGAVSRRLTEGWPFSRKTSVIALSQRLPCVKGDSPRCGEMSRSDRRVRPRKRCRRAAQTEGLSNHIVKPHIFPHAALCISPKVIQPLDTRCSDMLLYSHRRRIVDTRHIYHQKQKNPKKVVKTC